jgi:hypothetical protein
MRMEGRALRASWTGDPDRIRLWVLQTRRGNYWTTQILPQTDQSKLLSKQFPDMIALTAIDRCGMASPTSVVEWRHAAD